MRKGDLSNRVRTLEELVQVVDRCAFCGGRAEAGGIWGQFLGFRNQAGGPHTQSPVYPERSDQSGGPYFLLFLPFLPFLPFVGMLRQALPR